jgi:5-methylcytosine-specific restriction endonuclease McrA
MVGNKYNRLFVVELDHKDNKSRKFYLCLCDCGNKKILNGALIKSGNTKSCGCLAKETRKATRISLHHSEVTAVYLGYKRHARDRGYKWKLNRNDVESIIKNKCYYCGSTASNIKITKNTIIPLKYNGIDRVNNRIGYTLKNIVPCCRICNRAKGNLTKSKYIKWINKISAMAEQWGKV